MQERAPDTVLAGGINFTGEHFDFQHSARKGDGRFRFRWTLQPGKKGPPEHIHPGEDESFAVLSGELHVWVDGVKHALQAGDVLTVARGVRHRFLSAGAVPAVVDVALTGDAMERNLVPTILALGAGKFGVKAVLRMIVNDGLISASVPVSPAGQAIGKGLVRLLVFLGVKPFEHDPTWDDRFGTATRLRR